MKRRTKNVLLTFVLLLIMGTISYFGYKKVYKKPLLAKDTVLVKSVTTYDKVNGKWKKHDVINYTYQNSYPIKKELYEYDSKTPVVEKYDYTIDDGKPTSMKASDSDGNIILSIKYKNGNVYDEERFSTDGSSSTKRIYQYANSDNYFTLLFNKSVNKDLSENNYPTYNAEEVDSISVTTKNDLLKKTINTGVYSNYDDGTDDEWLRFNGIYTVFYDDNGIAKETFVENRKGYSGITHKFELTKKSGLVIEAVRSTWNDQVNEWVEDNKFTFEYNDMKIDRARYASMINAHIMREENTYYFYFWN